MPVSLLNTDTSFPSFQEDTSTKERVEVLTNYLYMLLEELRYTFNNLGEENFNDQGLVELSEKITKPLYIKIEDAEKNVAEVKITANELSAKVENVSGTVANLSGTVGDHTASIELLTKSVNEDKQALASFKTTVSNTYATISSFTSFKNEMNQSYTSFTQTADSTYAKTEAFTSFKNEMNQSYASFTQAADSTYAKSQQIASITNSYGNVTAASIVAAVNNAGSSVKISADHVDITGFVTFSSLETDGGSAINGNNIILMLNGAYDNGYTDLTSQSSLSYRYTTSYGSERTMARIFTSVDGSSSDTTSRYALNIEALPFSNNNGSTVYPALKLFGAGRVSMESNYGIYMATYMNAGYITLSAVDNTRIIASKSYRNLIEPADAGTYMYCFCTDGIYYNGTKILSV